MSDSDDDFVEYGSALEPLDEDAIPRKRPLTLEDQVVKDAHGRRRFHGAFTGGFSAGFFNTVGSLEGWTPSSFKSSRSERVENKTQKPEDFMDDEDTGEFGIAPKVLRATNDFSHLKRSRERAPRSSDGPIPGEPVLKLLLQPARETAGARLLRRMGWRPGQGVGPRVAPRAHRLRRPRIVGCTPPPGLGAPQVSPPASQSSSSEDEDDEAVAAAGITFAPEDVPAFLCRPKADVFGLGYEGLNRRPVLSGGGPGSQAPSRRLVLGGGRGGSVAVTGQAFGVGALEEEDEDIYAQEDMSQYDFALGGPASSRSGARPSGPALSESWLDNFSKALRVSVKEFFPPPPLPKDYTPVHAPRRSRFDQPQSEAPPQPPRARNAAERAVMVEGGDRGDEDEEEGARERERLRAQALKLTEGMGPSPGAGAGAGGRFAPFAGHPEKQRRYEQYLALTRSGHPEKLSHLQPLNMNEWERHREKTEFEQAARLFRPLSADMGERFVSASQPDDATDPLTPVEKLMGATPDQRNAAKMKMFGKMTREEEPWPPCDLLCKRFNIAKPAVSNISTEAQKRKKVSVFDFLKAAKHNTMQSKLPEEQVVPPPAASTSLDPVSTLASLTTDTKCMPSAESETLAQRETTPVSISVPEIREKPEDSVEDFAFPEPSEKVDLFKAIFLSSSESEEEEEQKEESDTPKEDNQTNKELSHLVASAPATLPGVLPDPPKRPTTLAPSAKSGVFANLDLDALNHPTPKPASAAASLKENEAQKRMTAPLSQTDDSVYGPQLPASVSASSITGRVLPSVVAPPQSHSPPFEWVEATSTHKKKKEKKKKEKKHKDKKSSKHKKHKHSKK